MTSISISVENLQKSYGTNQVLKDISFSVPRGTMLALLGPNGAGKTTTVRILSTLLRYDAGKVLIENHDLATHPNEIRSVIGLTGQSASVDELLTGRENLEMMGQLYRLSKQSARLRATALLTDFDLNDTANKPAKEYSGGMRRRLDLAVSLIANPPIIFLDEPTTGLDPRSRLAMWEIIRNLMRDGITVLLTTQYLEEADQLADNIILINHGVIAAEGTAESLKKQMGNDKLKLTFVDEKNFKRAADTLTTKLNEKDEKTLTLSVDLLDTSRDIKACLDVLDKNNISFDSMSVSKPSLDDVFLKLTEKQAN